MKKCFFILFSLLSPLLIMSQTVKVSNGLAFSSINFNDIDVFKENVQFYSMSIGFDYIENTYWGLSSELGYVRKGAKEKNLIIDNVATDLVEYWNFLHLNTTIRAKYPLRGFDLYIGIGPKLDILLSSDEFESEYFRGYNLNKYSFGLKPEIGFNQHLGEKIKVGLNVSYLLNFRGFGRSEYNDLSNNTFFIMFSLGYVIKSK